MKNIAFQIYFFLSYFLGCGQSSPLLEIAPLPSGLTECSGMAKIAPNALAMINDSGNKPELFVTDTTGVLLYRSVLPNMRNVDWESLAYANGLLYIADMGNNRNRRRDLKIYILDIDSLLSHGRHRLIGEISINYREQDGFPPEDNQRYYDAEALIHSGDSLFIFTKNRTKPFDGYSLVYGFPAQPGSYELSELGRIKTGMGLRASYWVSGASLSEDGSELALLGYDKMWLIDRFQGNRFWEGRLRTFVFNHVSQKEAICYVGNQIYVAEEQRGKGPAYLYRVQHDEKLQPGSDSVYLRLAQKEFVDSLNLLLNCEAGCTLRWEIFGTNGQRMRSGKLKLPPEEKGEVSLDMRELPPGRYIFNALIHGKPHAFFIHKTQASLPAKD